VLGMEASPRLPPLERTLLNLYTSRDFSPAFNRKV